MAEEAVASQDSGQESPKKSKSSSEDHSKRSLWWRFFKRFSGVLLRPTHFWKKIDEEDLSSFEIWWPHVALLVLARAVSLFIGSLLGDTTIGTAILQFFGSIVSLGLVVLIFALVAGAIASARGSRLDAQDALKFSAYGLTPFFVVGMLSVIPHPLVSTVADYVAMPYAFYVLATGVTPLLGNPPEKAAGTAGLICGALLICWGLIPQFLPVLIETLSK